MITPEYADLSYLKNHVAHLLYAGDYSSAINFCYRILDAEPTDMDTGMQLTKIFLQTGQYQLAIDTLEALKPFHPESDLIFFTEGECHFRLRNFKRALDCFTQSAVLNPRLADAYTNKGISQRKLGYHQDAVQSYTSAIALNPDFGNYYSRGVSFLDIHDFDSALSDFKQSIRLKNDFPQAYLNCGQVYAKIHKYLEAISCYDFSIKINPRYAEAYVNRGAIFTKMDFIEKAFLDFDVAIALDPSLSTAFSNRGILFATIKNYSRAIADFQKAIDLDPTNAENYLKTGLAYNSIGNYKMAIKFYSEALFHRNFYPEAEWNMGLINLLLGEFQLGWKSYEYRWQVPELSTFKGKRSFSEPLWLGQYNLTKKTILIYSEQGFGDTIQFCRYLYFLMETGVTIIFEAPLPLISLLSCINGIDHLVTKGDSLPNFDYQCPLMSLPLALGNLLPYIPSSSRYLSANREKLDHWTSRLKGFKNKKIGIAWSGNTTHKNDANRSIPLTDFLTLINENCDYICLQKDIGSSDKATLREFRQIHTFDTEIFDFSDTAALCESLDLIVCVDTSVAHLAAALGKETWILLPFNPDWRWRLETNQSAWYPSARLFRQPVLDDWLSVLKEVRQAIYAHFNLHDV